MPLTGRGVSYLFLLVGLAIATAYVVIRGLGILDDDAQYAVTIGLIVLFIGLFFCRDSIWIGLKERMIGSLILATTAFLFLLGIGLFFDYFFGI
ncbi:MAG TPA: hypothetical protein VMZ26_15535 [Pyrinomonadaceae bacterium]|nr:hypothetical protein [Pyrinomonadaceae bacterium]